MTILPFPRSSFFVLGVALAGLLSLGTVPLFADAAPRPQPPAAPRLAPDANPTAQGHLDAAQRAVDQALAALKRAATNDNHGRYDQAATTDLAAVAADLANAAQYVKAHPDANALASGPAPAGTVLEKIMVMPAAARGPGGTRSGAVVQTNMITAFDSLNAALNEFIIPTAPDYKGPIMGDFGGIRAKIIADLERANTNVLAGINYANGVIRNPAPSAATAPAATTPTTPAPNPPADAKAPTADALTPAGTRTGSAASVFASLALSLGLTLGGLHYFSRPRRIK